MTHVPDRGEQETELMRLESASGRGSRRKGANAEWEFAALLREHGIEARRNPSQQLFGGADVLGVELAGRELHVEVKRCERLDLPRWLRQVAADCAPHCVPVIAFRRSHEAWQVVLPLGNFLEMVEARA